MIDGLAVHVLAAMVTVAAVDSGALITAPRENRFEFGRAGATSTRIVSSRAPQVATSPSTAGLS